MIRRALPILAIVVVICSACTPSIRVQRLAPAAINLGPLRHIEVLAVEGRPAESQQALALLQHQATAGGWFSVGDRRSAQVRIEPSGSGMQFVPESEAPAPASGGLFLTIHAWNLDNELVMRTDVHHIDGHQHQSFSMHYLQRADVQIQALLVAADGRVLLDTTLGEQLYSDPQASLQHHEYRNRSSESVIVVHPARGDALLQQAGRRVMDRLLAPITPRWVRDKIPLCKDDKRQEPFIDLARDGHLEAAESGFRRHLESSENACALYNLGAVLDAQGRYAEALEFYDRAIAQRNEAAWHKVAAACRQRMAEAQSLD